MIVRSNSSKHIILVITLLTVLASCRGNNDAPAAPPVFIEITSLSLPPIIITPTENLPQPSPSITASLTNTPSPTSTPLPSPTLHPLQSFLPDECGVDNWIPSISFWYEHFGYNAGACSLPSMSPNREYIVYIIVVKTGEGDDWNDDYVQVAKLARIDNNSSIEIYRAQEHGLDMYWSIDGRLVIVDFSVHCCNAGSTNVYDLELKRITHSIDGTIHQKSRNSTFSAFYIILRDAIFGSCIDQLIGFDFLSNERFPVIGSLSINSMKLLISDGPLWIENERVLILAVRDATPFIRIDQDIVIRDYRYGPAKVIMIDLRGSKPQTVLLHSNPDLDYSFDVNEDGSIEIVTTPYEPTACRGDI